MLPGENGFLDAMGVDSSEYGVCHSDELYLFWSPYWFGNYSLNKVTWLTGQGQLHVIYVDTIV